MEELIIKAMPRTEHPQKVRAAGYIPAVLHAHDASSTSVQFEAAAIGKIIAKHGHNAKIWVKLDSVKKFGYIKEIQKDPVEGKILHVTVQIVAKDEDVKMKLPIVYHGRDQLEVGLLHLQVLKFDIDVVGHTALMPDSIIVDVSKKALGDTVTATDFTLPKGIKNLDPAEEIFAIVKAKKMAAPVVEEPTAEPVQAESE